MNIFDIFITYVSWGDKGKNRPVLIIEHRKKIIKAFNITTQFENKNETIRSKYFRINDWRQSGLYKESYVDTNTIRDIPPVLFKEKSAIGRLTENDKRRLLEFLDNPHH